MRWQYQQFARPPDSLTVGEALDILAIYPDRPTRLFLWPAAQQALALNPFPPAVTDLGFPVPVVYPDRTRRAALLSAAMPYAVLDPNAQPLVQQLTAFTTYPDRTSRRALSPAQMPSFSYGTWEPIPNPSVAGVFNDTIHLGTKESTGVTGNPTIGGWESW